MPCAPEPGRAPARPVALLLTALLAHNAEELATSAAWLGRTSLPPAVARLLAEVYRRDRFALAMALLTVGVAGGTAPAARPGARRAARVALVPTGGLLANAAVHLGQAAVTRRYNPGLVTAVTVLLPAAAHAAASLHRSAGTEAAQTTRLLLAGGVLSVPAVVTALHVSRRVLR